MGDFQAVNAFDVRARLSEIRTPTLVIVGEHDVMTPVKYAGYLQQHIPNAELVVVPGAGHMAMIERPAAVSVAIEQFLLTIR